MDPSGLAGLPRAVSAERFATYVNAYRGRHDLAARLYFWNIELTGACWGPICVLEIALRNALHDAMRRGRRDDWWNDPGVRLLDRERRAVDDAVASLARRGVGDPVPGQVVAAMSFAFWVGLTGAGVPRDPLLSYETSLWQPRLIRAFPHLGAKRRKQLHRELDDIRRFRNRLAHHEPIFGAPVGGLLADVLALLGHIDPDLADAVQQVQRIDDVLERKRHAISAGVASL